MSEFRPCRECRRPHELRNIADNMVTWADPDDGHPYHPEPWEMVARRLRRQVEAVKVEALELQCQHYPFVLQEGKEPVGCDLCYPGDSKWPCVSRMCADDILTILERGE